MKLTLVLLFVSLAFTQDLFQYLVIDSFGPGADIQKTSVVLSVQVSGTLDVANAAAGIPVIGTSSFTESTGTSGIIGGTRDLEIKVYNGLSSREFTSDIFSTDIQPYYDFTFEGEWTISSPKNSASRYTVQYDGTPGFTLNTSGLGSIDFTVGGLSLSSLRFGFFLISDLATTFNIKLYNANGNFCQANLNVPVFVVPAGGYDPSDILRTVFLSSFTGNCQLTAIGAVEMTLASQDALDAIVRDVSVFGPRPSPSATPTSAPSASRTPTSAPSASRTPAPTQSNTPAPSQSRSSTPAPSASKTPTPGPSESRTPAPSASNTSAPSQSRSSTPAPSASQTPTPAPSASRTPTSAPSESRTPAPSASNTPSTSVQCSVICNCPVFTCHLLFDDDEADVIYNGR